MQSGIEWYTYTHVFTIDACAAEWIMLQNEHQHWKNS